MTESGRAVWEGVGRLGGSAHVTSSRHALPFRQHAHAHAHADGERCFSRGVLCIEPCELCRVLLRWSVGSDAQYLRLRCVSELSNCGPAELCLAYMIYLRLCVTVHLDMCGVSELATG